LKNEKFENEVILGAFNCQKSEKKIVKITKFLYLVPIRSPKHKKGGLIFVFSKLVCSQIWLNLPLDDHHFGYITIFFIKNHCKRHDYFST
jgi:hypothetical protein